MSTQIQFLGHSSVLVESGELNFLTDPIFSEKAFFFKRLVPLPISPEKLPEPTAIFISNSHYRHLDLPAFKYFSSKIPIIIPKGLERLLSKFIRNPLIELSPGGNHQICPGLEVTAFQVSHHGSRLTGLTYRNDNGYLITYNGKKIFFIGDSAYRADFKKVVEKSGPIDLALLPIGPCQPEWLMRRRHLMPEDFLKLVKELDPELTIPIHWGFFPMGIDPRDYAIEKLGELLKKKKISTRKISILKPGEIAVITP